MSDGLELIVRGLACVRGERTVFAELSFEVAAGAVLAVTGPNGAGKSSLLRIVAGLLTPAQGEIALRGGDADSSLAEQGHYLGHKDALKPSLSVRENLRFWVQFLGEGSNAPAPGVPLPPHSGGERSGVGGLGEMGQSPPTPDPSLPFAALVGGGEPPALPLKGKEDLTLSLYPSLIQDPLLSALAIVGLDQVADLPAGYLSAGQRRRLSIARLVAIPRPVWLLDEPLTALDAGFQARLVDLMRAHLAGGGLIMAATHAPLGLDAAELRLGASIEA